MEKKLFKEIHGRPTNKHRVSPSAIVQMALTGFHGSPEFRDLGQNLS